REVRGIVQDDMGNQPLFMHILCWTKGDEFRRWGTWKGKGEFVIRVPNNAQSLTCWSSDSEIYETYEDESAIDVDGRIVLQLARKTIAILAGVITTPRGKPIPNVLVEVQDTTGTSVRTQANDKGEFQFKNLKAGRAQVVKYTAEGYEEARPPQLDLS